MSLVNTSYPVTEYMRTRPRRACAVNTARNIQRVLNWEYLSDNSDILRRMADQIDREFETELASGSVVIDEIDEIDDIDESEDEKEESDTEIVGCDVPDEVIDEFYTNDGHIHTDVFETGSGNSFHMTVPISPMSDSVKHTTHDGEVILENRSSPTTDVSVKNSTNALPSVTESACNNDESNVSGDSDDADAESSQFDSSFVSSDGEYMSDDEDWEPPLKRVRLNESDFV